MVHELKTWPEYFEPVFRRQKTAELRRNDRQYNVGDVLYLREWEPLSAAYTGRDCYRVVTHIVRGGEWLAPGYCMLSVWRPVDMPPDLIDTSPA